MNKEKKECSLDKAYAVARKKFDSLKGIINPIRAIIEEHSIYKHNDAFNAYASASKKCKDNFLKYSSIIGYFTAVQSADKSIHIGWSFCSPEDMFGFNPKIGKLTAINRCLNFANKSEFNMELRTYDEKFFVNARLFESRSWKKRVLFIRNYNCDPSKFFYFGGDGHQVCDQFDYFTDRCVSYFKLTPTK